MIHCRAGGYETVYDQLRVQWRRLHQKECLSGKSLGVIINSFCGKTCEKTCRARSNSFVRLYEKQIAHGMNTGATLCEVKPYQQFIRYFVLQSTDEEDAHQTGVFHNTILQKPVQRAFCDP